MATFSGGSGAGGSSFSSSSNMDPASQAALQALISTLASGGTSFMQDQKAGIKSEIGKNQQVREDYSKDAAFADSQAAMQANLNKVLAQLLPGITRAAEGSGTSQSSMRALLTQDAANKAAESAATLGINAATAYGGIGNNASSIIANLLGKDDPATTALLAALGIAKGSQTSSNTPRSSGGMVVPNYGGSGNGSSAYIPAPAQPYMMSGSTGMTDTQAQLDSINRQLGIINSSGSNAFDGLTF